MKNFLIAFFVFLLWSIFGMWYHSCIIKEICTDISTVNSVTIGKEAVTNNNKAFMVCYFIFNQCDFVSVSNRFRGVFI